MYKYIYIYIYIKLYMGRFINCLDRQRSPSDWRWRGYINKFAWPSAIGVADPVPLYTARCFINHRERARGGPSAPDPKNHHAREQPRRTFWPLALQGSIFSIFWSIGKASQNDDFLASHQNGPNGTINRPLGTRGSILNQNT